MIADADRESPGRVRQVDAERSETDEARSLVIGGTGLVGGYIVEHLLRMGQRPFVLSRSHRNTPGIDWFQGDLEKPDALRFPAFTTLFCTADAVLLADALPRLFNPSLKRVVAFSSTSVITKQDTEVEAEREMIGRLADAERRIAAACERHNVGWTILRPTLIYAEGRDTNIHAAVAAHSQVRLHAAGRRSTGFAPAGACGGSGDRRACRCLKPRRDQQVLLAARGRDAHLPGDDRPGFRRTGNAEAYHPVAAVAVASRHSFWQNRCFPAPMSRWACA